MDREGVGERERTEKECVFVKHRERERERDSDFFIDTTYLNKEKWKGDNHW